MAICPIAKKLQKLHKTAEWFLRLDFQDYVVALAAHAIHAAHAAHAADAAYAALWFGKFEAHVVRFGNLFNLSLCDFAAHGHI